MKSCFYTDIQLRLLAGEADRFGFARGVNNLFSTRAPGCITCDINNFDQTVYDVTGSYFYARERKRSRSRAILAFFLDRRDTAPRRSFLLPCLMNPSLRHDSPPDLCFPHSTSRRTASTVSRTCK